VAGVDGSVADFVRMMAAWQWVESRPGAKKAPGPTAPSSASPAPHSSTCPPTPAPLPPTARSPPPHTHTLCCSPLQQTLSLQMDPSPLVVQVPFLPAFPLQLGPWPLAVEKRFCSIEIDFLSDTDAQRVQFRKGGHFPDHFPACQPDGSLTPRLAFSDPDPTYVLPVPSPNPWECKLPYWYLRCLSSCLLVS
jgi:hypothetical protein